MFFTNRLNDVNFNYLHILERLFRLAACLPVFHQLIHVADGLRWIGPIYTHTR